MSQRYNNPILDAVRRAHEEIVDHDAADAAIDAALNASGAGHRRRRARGRRFVVPIAVACVAMASVAALAVPESGPLAGAARELGVFSESQDREPSKLLDERSRDHARQVEIVEHPSPELRAGIPLSQQYGRVLIKHKNRGVEVEIFAVPTDIGGVCYTVTVTRQDGGVPGSSECIRSLLEYWPLDASGIYESGELPVRYGVVSDRVKAIKVIASESTQWAAVDGNGYVWIGTTPTDRPTRFEIHLRDGTVLTHTSDAVPPPAPKPLRDGEPAPGSDPDLVQPPSEAGVAFPNDGSIGNGDPRLTS